MHIWPINFLHYIYYNWLDSIAVDCHQVNFTRTAEIILFVDLTFYFVAYVADTLGCGWIRAKVMA